MLSTVQERAICLLVQGNSDRKTAEAINVCRETVTRWRNENPYFAAELNRQRRGIWAGAEDKLRGLVSKATDTLESAIDQGDVKAAVAVLKATGIYGQVGQPTGSVDPEIVLWQEADLEERRKLLIAMLDAVYVDTKEEKRIVAVEPKPAFRPIIQVATTREGSGVILIKEPPEDSQEASVTSPCSWWRRGRVELPVQKKLSKDMLQA